MGHPYSLGGAGGTPLQLRRSWWDTLTGKEELVGHPYSLGGAGGTPLQLRRSWWDTLTDKV